MKVSNKAASQPSDIIIIEDNNELRDILATGLTLFGHRVRSVANGPNLCNALADAPADIIILDLGLPGEDGIVISQRLSQQDCGCGIIMLTARGNLDDRILGLASGADLYFVKPVDIRELDAAIRSLSRRLPVGKQTGWRFVPLTSTIITPGGTKIPLTANEFIFLRKLLETPGENVPRREIFADMHQPDDYYADRRIETMISRLRAKVRAADPEAELPVRARHNLGYAFLAEVSQTVPRD